MINNGYQLELRHLRYFMAVAKELHFRRAADQLFVSQPALSVKIKQLEGILGTNLFVRQKKKVYLTSAGQYLFGEGAKLMGQVERITKQVRLIHEGLVGELKIGFLGSAMHKVIPDLLLNLSKQSPNVQSHLQELSNEVQIEKLLHGKLDLGFVRLDKVPEDLELCPVVPDTFSLVVPKSNKIGKKGLQAVKMLSKEPFILFPKEYSPQYHETVIGICQAAGFEPKVAHKSVHAHTIFKLVENGMGVAIVPTKLKSGFNLDINFIVLDDIPQKAMLYAVWKPENTNPVLVKCMDYLRNYQSMAK